MKRHVTKHEISREWKGSKPLFENRVTILNTYVDTFIKYKIKMNIVFSDKILFSTCIKFTLLFVLQTGVVSSERAWATSDRMTLDSNKRCTVITFLLDDVIKNAS